MAQIHAAAGWAVWAATLVHARGAAVRKVRRPPSWFEIARRAVMALLGVQAALGGLVFTRGDRPQDSLHLLYALAALRAIPLAGAFASEATPRARAGTLCAGGLLTLGLVWRLFVTG